MNAIGNSNYLTFEDWEALYNVLSALETIVLSPETSTPPVWENINRIQSIGQTRSTQGPKSFNSR